MWTVSPAARRRPVVSHDARVGTSAVTVQRLLKVHVHRRDKSGNDDMGRGGFILQELWFSLTQPTEYPFAIWFRRGVCSV